MSEGRFASSLVKLDLDLNKDYFDFSIVRLKSTDWE